MADEKKTNSKTNSSNSSKIVGLNESKVPDYKFTPPPPKVKTDKK